MVLTTSELIAAMQSEVRILLHLASKLDAGSVDYRPTPGQRSSLELLRYLSFMGPTIVRFALASPPDFKIWFEAENASRDLTFDEVVARIGEHPAEYAALLGDVPEAKFREPFTDFARRQTTVGGFIVSLVLCGHAAYRTQLFLYLKSCGQTSLSTVNLWAGVDAAPAA